MTKKGCSGTQGRSAMPQVLRLREGKHPIWEGPARLLSFPHVYRRSV